MRTEDKKGWLDIEEKGRQVALTFLNKKICCSPLVKMHEMSRFFASSVFIHLVRTYLDKKSTMGVLL